MTINNEFWQSYEISNNDLDALYNYLLETETPLNKFEISKFLINQIITTQSEIRKAEKLSGGSQYLPNVQYKVGEDLVFPQFSWKKGKVISTRPGHNPEYPNLEVINVLLSTNEIVSLASNYAFHKLNDPIPEEENRFLISDFVYEQAGEKIAEAISTSLSENPDLVCIAGSFFPRALLVDVGIGHLNLCEAVLEMSNGGPLTTPELINQVELPTDVNANLTEFSLNLALQEDERFDEVGPAGKTLWFLKRLEPPEVQSPPLTLLYTGPKPDSIDHLAEYLAFTTELCDELEPDCDHEKVDSIKLSLSYPHWRAGTLPLTSNLKNLFPTAYETPRVKFNFVDGNNHDIFPGWVVRPSRYIYGLKTWYEQQGLIPGSIVTIKKGQNPGEVIVQVEKNRNNKDWIRTILVGADGGFVFALLKQVITCTFDDRMAVMVPDVPAIDALWANANKSKQPVEKVILSVMRELGKLNPQGQIHAQEIYAAVNVVRRVPPSVILNTLFSQPWSHHLGDLYFKLDEN